MDQLAEWRLRPARRPLLVNGARQVGKTYSLREFGRSYENVVYFNFETNPA